MQINKINKINGNYCDIYCLNVLFLACDCHVLGSYNQSCDLVTGQCPCRPGVVNTKCDKCAVCFIIPFFDG